MAGCWLPGCCLAGWLAGWLVELEHGRRSGPHACGVYASHCEPGMEEPVGMLPPEQLHDRTRVLHEDVTRIVGPLDARQRVEELQ